MVRHEMTRWVKSIWLLRILSIRKRALRICSVAFELNHPADLTRKIFNPWNIETKIRHRPIVMWPLIRHVTWSESVLIFRVSYRHFRLFVGISDFRPELRNVIKKSSISIKFVKNMSRISISRFYKFGGGMRMNIRV